MKFTLYSLLLIVLLNIVPVTGEIVDAPVAMHNSDFETNILWWEKDTFDEADIDIEFSSTAHSESFALSIHTKSSGDDRKDSEVVSEPIAIASGVVYTFSGYVRDSSAYSELEVTLQDSSDGSTWSNTSAIITSGSSTNWVFFTVSQSFSSSIYFRYLLDCPNIHGEGYLYCDDFSVKDPSNNELLPNGNFEGGVGFWGEKDSYEPDITTLERSTFRTHWGSAASLRVLTSSYTAGCGDVRSETFVVTPHTYNISVWAYIYNGTGEIRATYMVSSTGVEGDWGAAQTIGTTSLAMQWQHLSVNNIIPASTYYMKIRLECINAAVEAYIDDITITDLSVPENLHVTILLPVFFAILTVLVFKHKQKKY